jgi:hypothetical protein
MNSRMYVPLPIPNLISSKTHPNPAYNKWDDILLHLVDFEQFSFAKDILLGHFVHISFAHNMKELFIDITTEYT